MYINEHRADNGDLGIEVNCHEKQDLRVQRHCNTDKFIIAQGWKMHMPVRVVKREGFVQLRIGGQPQRGR